MQVDKRRGRGAVTHRPDASGGGAAGKGRGEGDGEVLSPVDLERAQRGREFKRLVRSDAARRDIYEDTELAEAIGVSRQAVQGWWAGARPSVYVLRRISEATGTPVEVLEAIAYPDPMPELPPELVERMDRLAATPQPPRAARPPAARADRPG